MDQDILRRFRERWTKFFRDHESDKKKIQELEYNEFMNDASDEWERMGNNFEPLQPEDSDVDEVPFEVAGNPSDSECSREDN